MPAMMRSASGEGFRSSELMIHCSVGMKSSSTRIAAPKSQLRTTSHCRTSRAIGNAAEYGWEVIVALQTGPYISINDTLFIDIRQVVGRGAVAPLLSWRPAGGGASEPARPAGPQENASRCSSALLDGNVVALRRPGIELPRP